VAFFFTKSCREKRREKPDAEEKASAIFDVEISTSNVFYNKPIVAAATKYVAENILAVFSTFRDFFSEKIGQNLPLSLLYLLKNGAGFFARFANA